MTFEPQFSAVFSKDAASLKLLEKAFNKAGHPITFHAFVDAVDGKRIKVTGGRASQKIINIDADSPAAAIKDVAAGVLI